MKIEAAIKYLEGLKAQGETDIIMATWEKEAFTIDEVDWEYDWEYFCDRVDDDMDWSYTHEGLEHILTEIKEND